MAFVLASRSPRRLALLRQIGLDPVVMVSDADETLPPKLSPEKAAVELACRKGSAVSSRLSPDDTLLAADTLVWLDGQALGQPVDPKEAYTFLRMLSGRAHKVVTGVMVRRGDTILTNWASTMVWFRSLSDAEIWDYIRTGEPMDKAGAYGVQAMGAMFIPKIEGDFFNVCGLPLCLTWELLEQLWR